MLDYEYIGWEPFGLKDLTFREWDDLVTWYVQKNISERLDTTEEDNNAFKLYS